MKSNKSLNKLVFIGSGNFLNQFYEIAKKLKIELYLISSPDQSKNSQVRKEIKKIIVKNINEKSLEKFFLSNNLVSKNTIFISYSSRYLFKTETINKLFYNNLYNIHCSRLPLDKGGGGLSWRIMRNDRLGNLCLHKIQDEKIDNGKIYKFENYVINKAFTTPKEIKEDIERRLMDFLKEFIIDLKNNKKLNIKNIPNYLGSYFPRLNTPVSSWIDWKDSSFDIFNFINAFDDPFTGAQSWISSKKITKIKIKKAQLSSSEFNSNSLTKGMIYRHDNKWINVSLDNQFSLIIEDIRDFKNNSVLDLLNEGDQFYSKNITLKNRNSQRFTYNSEGLKKK
mgnify:FL=1|tara:strand:+ start:162 stop:1175 length:1014 start_codon:yes stop_codon:yes gene_type:complete